MTLAFWCVLVAAILPYLPFGIANRFLDPKTPRKAVANLEGLAARAHGAHLNAFEAFAPFAAAVIISHVVEGASSLVNALAVLFIFARIAHLGFYLADRQPARSASFTFGAIVIVVIFVQNAFH